jgi:hypothetical protein
MYRTEDVATLDGFLSPANDKGAIRPSRKPECRFFGEEIDVRSSGERPLELSAPFVVSDPDRIFSRLDLGRKMPTLGLRASGAKLAVKRREFITLIAARREAA